MEMYHWKLDIPGGFEGVLLAENGVAAFSKLKAYVERLFDDVHIDANDIFMEWLGNAPSEYGDVYPFYQD